MTAWCGGGPSGTKPGYGTIVSLSSAAIGAALDAATESAIGTIVGALIAGVAYDLATICAEDPPADPNITQDDVDQALDLTNIPASDAAIARLRQWFLHYYWFVACECTGAPTPAPPALSSPTGVALNSGLPSGASGARCWEQTTTISWAAPTTPGTALTQDLTAQCLPPSADTLLVNYAGATTTIPVHAVRIPAGTTSVYFNNTATGFTGPGLNAAQSCSLLFYTAAGAANGGIAFLNFNNTTPQTILPPNALFANSAYMAVVVNNNYDSTAATHTYSFNVHVWLECGASALNTPCCPPDPLLDQRLNQIVGLLNQIYNSLGVGPDTYTPGPVHTALSGEQSFLLSKGTVALKVVATSDLSGFFTHQQLPTYYFSLGFLTPVAIGTPLRGSRLIYGQQIYPLQPETDQVYLSLAAGVVVNVTELNAGVR